MSPAVPQLEAALAATPLTPPRLPVVSNVDAAPHADPEVIKAILARQLTSPVQWESSLKILVERGLKDSYELGPGKVKPPLLFSMCMWLLLSPEEKVSVVPQVIAGTLKRVDKTAAPAKNFSV